MKRWTFVILAICVSWSCKDDDSKKTAEAQKPTWTAQVAELESVTGSNVEVKVPGADEFVPWRGGQPIPAGAAVRTPETVRATLSLPGDGTLTMNHSTHAVLAERSRLKLASGQAVVAFPPGNDSDVTVGLPTGEVVLHGTKVALVAGEEDSTVTVTQGLVEVRHGGEAFEARAGQELVLREGEAPIAGESPDLARRVGWSEIGEADFTEELPEVPRGLGKLVGKTPGGEAEHRLDLDEHRVSVKVQGNIAYTEITEVFENPTGRTLEGLYRFPLPSDARISRLALKVGNRVMEGEFLETARAERIWRDVIHQWRDPAMLKWKEGNTFELRIFPIEPRQKRQVTIGYVQRLEPSVGGYRYTYPMPVDQAGLIEAGRFEFDAELHGHDPTLPLEVTGYPAFVEHGATKNDEAITKVRWSADDFVARGDLAIRFGRDEASGLRAYTYRDDDEKSYAVFALRPDLPARTEVKPRDFVVVVDSSTSRRGAAMKVQRRLVPRLIREMDPLDRVTVVACAERCQAVGEPSFSAARLSTSTSVAEGLLDLEASGATYPVEAVRVAAELFRRRDDNGREAHVIYMTDGVASAGELRPGRIADAVQATLKPHDARMSIVDIGGNSDDTTLEALATGGHGRVEKLDPMLSMTGQALAILNGHYRSILSNPHVELPGGVAVDGVLPTAIAAGDEVVFAARFDDDVDGELKLKGNVNGDPFEMVYPVALRPDGKKPNSFAPAEWAAHRIASLELEPEDHEDEIVRLSKRYGVLSRFTTLLALESKEMMDEYNVRARNRTKWTGDDAAETTADAAAEDSGAPAAPAKKERKSRRTPSRRSPKGRAPMEKSKSAAPQLFDLDTRSGDGADFAAPQAEAEEEAKPRKRPKPKPKPSSSPVADVLGGSGSFEPPRRRHRRRRVYRPRARIEEAQSTTSWEQRNVSRKRARLRSDRNNRTKRMRLIRAMVRADQISTARRETEVWLAKNPMDPEAIVQMAQIRARKGKLDLFYDLLISAADAAPRGEWLLERIHGAAKAQNDDALECAYEVALEAVAKRPPKTPSDIIACPMATPVGTWFGEAGPNLVLDPAVESQPSGALEVSLKSSGGDWDLALVEPSGRLLWWGSSRQRLKFENVRGADRTEYLTLPRFRRGTYSVLVIPREPKEGDRLEIAIDARGKKKTLHVAPRGVEEVAEVVWK